MDVNPLSSSSQVLGSESQEKAALRAAGVKDTDHHDTIDAKVLGRSTSPNGGVRETKISCSEQPGQPGDGAPAEPSKEEARAKEKAELKAGWGAYMVAQHFLHPLERQKVLTVSVIEIMDVCHASRPRASTLRFPCCLYCRRGMYSPCPELLRPALDRSS